MRVAAYPGTFDPPTIAHLAIAEAALDQGGVERVELVVSRFALGKPEVGALEVARRLSVLEAVATRRDWLGVRLSVHRLIADVAAGYDAVVVGADKWVQLLDPAWYGGSVEARDEALARLPRILVVPRSGHPAPAGLPAGALVLELDARHGPVSSSAVRAGRLDWMLPEVGGGGGPASRGPAGGDGGCNSAGQRRR